MPKQNVPALRLHGFSGEWNEMRLDQLFSSGSSGGTPSTNKPEFYGGDIPFLGISDIHSREVLSTEKTITQLGLENSAATLVPPGTVALAMYASVGRVGILCQEMATSQAFYNMTFSEKETRDFVFTRLQMMESAGEWEPVIGAGTQRNLNAEKVRATCVQIPPTLEEQQAIGAIFTNLDAAINQHTLKHKALQQAKRALMQRMFPQEGQTVPELRLEGFSGEWKTTSIGAVSALHNGRDYKHLGEGCIPVYGTGGYMASVDQALSHDKDAVGIGRKGTINKPYILRAPFWTVDTLFYVVPNQDTDLAFFYASVLQVDWMAKNTATGLPSLTSQAINSADISVPATLEEQQAIGAIFTNLDQLIAAEAQYIASLKQAKTALLQRMFI